MVKGNLILISSDIPDTLSKILPTDQQLLPVSLKRKIQYRGSFLEEWVDVNKVKLYFAWFKEHNPLFRDVELNEDLINQFQIDTMDAATEFESLKVKGDEEEESPSQDDMHHNHESDIDYDKCEECFLSDVENKIEPIDEIEEMNQTSMFLNKYQEDTDLPTVANKLADIIVELEISKNVAKNAEDDLLHEYKDLPIEGITEEEDERDSIEENLYEAEEQFKAKCTNGYQTLDDEIYLSEDETDILNTAMKYVTDDEDQMEIEEDDEKISSEFHLSVDILNAIKPQTCLQNSKELFCSLLLHFEKFDDETEKSSLNIFNEIVFKIIEKVDKYCSPSNERKNLIMSLNGLCDKIDEIIEKRNET